MPSGFPHGLGCVQAPPDTRDYPIAQLTEYAEVDAATLPTAYRLEPLPVAMDQGETPECVAFAAIGVKAYQEHLQLGRWIYGPSSADLLYRQCKAIDGLPAGTPGTYLRAACQVLSTAGATALDGHHYLIGAYYSLLAETDRGQAVRSTLAGVKRPVLIAMPWYQSYTDKSDAQDDYPRHILPLPDPGETPIAWHAVWIESYLLNASVGEYVYGAQFAWSSDVGIYGRYYLQPDHLAAATELWVTVDR